MYAKTIEAEGGTFIVFTGTDVTQQLSSLIAPVSIGVAHHDQPLQSIVVTGLG